MDKLLQKFELKTIKFINEQHSNTLIHINRNCYIFKKFVKTDHNMRALTPLINEEVYMGTRYFSFFLKYQINFIPERHKYLFSNILQTFLACLFKIIMYLYVLLKTTEQFFPIFSCSCIYLNINILYSFYISY